MKKRFVCCRHRREAARENITFTMQTRKGLDGLIAKEGMAGRTRHLNQHLINSTMPCESTGSGSGSRDRTRKAELDGDDQVPRKRWSSHQSLSATSSLVDIRTTEGLVPLSPNTLQLKQSVADGAACKFNRNIRQLPRTSLVATRSSSMRSSLSSADCGMTGFDYQQLRLSSSSTKNSDRIVQSLFQFKMRRMHPPHRDNFSVLPDEMILKVMKWLPKEALSRVSQTCKRLNRLAEDETLWRRVDVQGKFLYPGQFAVLMNRKPWFLRLARAEIKEPTGIPASFIASQLLYLDLSMTVVKSDTLTSLLGMCTSLVKLSLEQLNVPPETIQAMHSFATTIDTLNLTMCEKLESLPLAQFLSRARRLKSLNLGCVMVNWSHNDLMRVVSYLPEGMEQLNLAGFRNILKDSHVEVVVQRCRRLVDLDLSDSQEVSMVAMESIKNYLGRIQHLGLSRCYGINTVGYDLLSGIRNLKFLDVHHLKPESVKEIQDLLPKAELNKYICSSVARPTVGIRRSSIWYERVRD